MRDYTKIKAWALADDLTVEIYKATKRFPNDEVYSLTRGVAGSRLKVAGLRGEEDGGAV